MTCVCVLNGAPRSQLTADDQFEGLKLLKEENFKTIKEHNVCAIIENLLRILIYIDLNLFQVFHFLRRPKKNFLSNFSHLLM